MSGGDAGGAMTRTLLGGAEAPPDAARASGLTARTPRSRPAGRVAVVGGGLGGLAAAGHLAAQGHRVTLFEQATTLGGKASRFTSNGVTLDWGPTLLTMPSVVRGTFEALGATDLLPRLFELPHQCRYLGEGGQRFDAFAKLERTLASAEALRAGEGAAMRTFMSLSERLWRTAGEPYFAVPFRGSAEYLWRALRAHPREAWGLARLGSLASVATASFQSGLLRSFVERFGTYVGAGPLEASAIFAMLPHVERQGGVHHVEGGLGALAGALGQALTRLGVEVRTSTAVTARRLTGGGFELGEERFDAVVMNRDPLADSVGDAADTTPLALSGYVLLVEVSRRLALPHHTIAFSPDFRAELGQLSLGRLPQELTLAVCHPVATDATMAPEGKSGLYVMVNAPPLGPGADAAAWELDGPALRERVLRRLREVVPELAGATVTVLGERTPVDLQRLGAPRGSIYGFLPRGRWGPFRRPRQQSPVPGVFFAGGGTFPGGGVPLVLRSGAWAAQLASAWVTRGGR